METFTIHDVLINSTDLNQILCNFGIKNISNCGDEEESAAEPKGKANFSTSPPKADAFDSSTIGRIYFFNLAEGASLPRFQRKIKPTFSPTRVWFWSSRGGLRTIPDTYVASVAVWLKFSL